MGEQIYSKITIVILNITQNNGADKKNTGTGRKDRIAGENGADGRITL